MVPSKDRMLRSTVPGCRGVDFKIRQFQPFICPRNDHHLSAKWTKAEFPFTRLNLFCTCLSFGCPFMAAGAHNLQRMNVKVRACFSNASEKILLAASKDKTYLVKVSNFEHLVSWEERSIWTGRRNALEHARQCRAMPGMLTKAKGKWKQQDGIMSCSHEFFSFCFSLYAWRRLTIMLSHTHPAVAISTRDQVQYAKVSLLSMMGNKPWRT